MHNAAIVAGIAAVGGFLSWLFGLYLGNDPHYSALVDLIVSILLGAGAGIIFVYLIANTDRSDMTRLCALALLSGFFWEAVWVGSRVLIERQSENMTVAAVEDAAMRAETLTDSLATASPEERAAILDEIERETKRVAELTAKVDSVSRRAEIDSATEPLMAKFKQLPETENQSLLANLGASEVNGTMNPIIYPNEAVTNFDPTKFLESDQFKDILKVAIERTNPATEPG